MAIVRRSPHRWWVTLFSIAGSMLATVGASAHEMGGNGGFAVALGAARGGAAAPAKDAANVAGRRGATALQLTGHALAHSCSGRSVTDCICRLRMLTAREPKASQHVARTHQWGASASLRVLSQTHVRVTRLQNGSILCCRNLPPVHIMAVPRDVNDDTASDGGDDTSDDDDSQNDQNGDDDTDSLAIAWFQPIVPHAIGLECAPVTSWLFPSFCPFLSFHPLRC
jgi:hypothetical protein